MMKTISFLEVVNILAEDNFIKKYLDKSNISIIRHNEDKNWIIIIYDVDEKGKRKSKHFFVIIYDSGKKEIIGGM
ncbi:hypothetical protein [Armatimonas sp.]|uniref:hypothetical protein n=1 Tax=Armatimonas sp. TaxID=1872638 RepID=UPI00286C5AEE|nr:hypothetical protein [Armatimonas sp.]